jgi:hypothetical protein
VQTDGDLQALIDATYHRDGGAGHALTYWRGRQSLARDLLAARQALRSLLQASDLLLQLGGVGSTEGLRGRLEACRAAARACLPEHEERSPEQASP